MFNYFERIGISIVEHTYVSSKQTEVEKYLKSSGILNKYSNLIKLDVLDENADDSRIIQGIKRLIS